MFLIYLIVSFAVLMININTMSTDLIHMWILITLSVSAITCGLESKK